MSRLQESTPNLIDVLYDFLLANVGSDIANVILENLQNHYKYGTVDFEFDKLGVVYFVRYNVLNNKAQIIDYVVRNDCRNKNLIKYVVLKNWQRWPFLTHISFTREYKYPERGLKEYPIKKFIWRH